MLLDILKERAAFEEWLLQRLGGEMDKVHVVDVMRMVRASRPSEGEESETFARRALRELLNIAPPEVHPPADPYDGQHNVWDTSAQSESMTEASGCRY